MNKKEIIEFIERIADAQAGDCNTTERLAFRAGYYKAWLAQLIQQDPVEQQRLLELYFKVTTPKEIQNG